MPLETSDNYIYTLDPITSDFLPPDVISPETTVAAAHGVASISAWIVDFVHQFGYLGIFIMTFIESTFVPIPSEVTMVPAGYLIYQGQMNFYYVMAASIAGTVCGSLANYWIAFHYGRKLLERYGKYFFMTPEKMKKMEDFFFEHGAISTFSGRLIPGVRHYISFPAGLARMNLRLFSIYTALGGAIWMACLIGVGYFIGHEQKLIKKYLSLIALGLFVCIGIGVSIYIRRFHRRRKSSLGIQKSDI